MKNDVGLAKESAFMLIVLLSLLILRKFLVVAGNTDKTRDLKITHPVRLRRLDSNGIGRRGFIQQKKVAKIRLRLVGVASFYWPRQIMIVQRRAYPLQKRSASYAGW